MGHGGVQCDIVVEDEFKSLNVVGAFNTQIVFARNIRVKLSINVFNDLCQFYLHSPYVSNILRFFNILMVIPPDNISKY